MSVERRLKGLSDYNLRLPSFLCSTTVCVDVSPWCRWMDTQLYWPFEQGGLLIAMGQVPYHGQAYPLQLYQSRQKALPAVFSWWVWAEWNGKYDIVLIESKTIHAEKYSQLRDHNSSTVKILPADCPTSDWWYHRKYKNAMFIMQVKGKPTFLLRWPWT